MCDSHPQQSDSRIHTLNQYKWAFRLVPQQCYFKNYVPGFELDIPWVPFNPHERYGAECRHLAGRPRLDLKEFFTIHQSIPILHTLEVLYPFIFFCHVSTWDPYIKVTSVAQCLTFVQQGLSPKLKNVFFSSFEKWKMLTLHDCLGQKNNENM